jgi:signal transduction histidine kinase
MLWALAAVVAAMAVSAVVAWYGPAWSTALSTVTVVVAGWLAGENTRARRAYAQGMAERAAMRERQREEHIRRAASEERVRIARELHDVVAHAMSVVAVRSGVARLVLDSRPEEAREALSIIETTSRRALQEMRRLVGVLRQPEEGPAPELAPMPGLGRLEELVQETSLAGVTVGLHIEGQPGPLPEGVDVSAYRIVQEGLTNIVRHAPGATAQLWIRYLPHQVEIELCDDGGRHRADGAAAVDAEGGGHGLIGMRERVALYGGVLSAGPTADGFRVLAVLPVDRATV